MGETNVFFGYFNTFIGVGISFSFFETVNENDKRIKVLDIGISLPFLFIGIYFRKSKINKWF